MQQEHNMITFRKGNLKFTFRVAAVIIRDGHVLLQHAVQQGHWFLTGGRAELRESTAETITREIREELGIEVRVERLLWVVENFFELAEILHHELGLYFLVSIPDDAYLNNSGQSFIKTDADAGAELVFQWHPLDKLAAAPFY
ncbi:MAG: NUDIX domain-containing protein, partial [Chloroflexi bacterium]